MRPSDIILRKYYDERINTFQTIIKTPGLTKQTYDCFVMQLIDSYRRVNYVNVINSRQFDRSVCDPQSLAFDPIKAASLYAKEKNIDEAAWITFLAIHFGKNLRTKWKLLANVYGSLGVGPIVSWQYIIRNMGVFRNWLDVNRNEIKKDVNFGNHRKYESINGLKNNGTGAAINTYVHWVQNAGGHVQLFLSSLNLNESDPKLSFRHLYNSMNSIARFGRTAKFDYLAMIGKLQISKIEPDSTYMNGATGPYKGAEMLFGCTQSAQTFENWLVQFASHLNIPFASQILEDALCNWQKSPSRYYHFAG